MPEEWSKEDFLARLTVIEKKIEELRKEIKQLELDTSDS